jgi:hypothetical protein
VGNVTAAAAPQRSDLRQDAVMPDRYRAPGGWTVQVIHLTATSGNRDGEWLRVALHGWWVADVRTVAELARWIDLAELEPDGLSAGGWQGHPTVVYRRGITRPGQRFASRRAPPDSTCAEASDPAVTVRAMSTSRPAKSVAAEARFRARLAELGAEITGPYVDSHTPVLVRCAAGHECRPDAAACQDPAVLRP